VLRGRDGEVKSVYKYVCRRVPKSVGWMYDYRCTCAQFQVKEEANLNQGLACRCERRRRHLEFAVEICVVALYILNRCQLFERRR